MSPPDRLELVANVSDVHITEHEDHWSIEATGATVTRVSFDWAVTLLVDLGSTTFEVRIEDEFTLSGPERSATTVDPEGSPEQLTAALSLRHQEVDHIHAFKDGSLRLTTTEGVSVHVDGSDECEPWEVASAEKTRIVSTPSGELAIWQ